ncbi:MAG TPA: prenyltransferase/squalene oxidase repeat-containing protein [Desulfobacteria bacterium]|nr:prenyltransferase/squalene oxidase repeat-containing protein [Desulfobacteria bacterium]
MTIPALNSTHTQARRFITQGIEQLTGSSSQSRFLVSAAPIPTALAMIALAAHGKTNQARLQQGAAYLAATRQNETGWGNTPAGPPNPLATAICDKGLQACELGSITKEIIYEAAYLVAKTWTQDFDRLTPGWLPKQGSPLIRLLEALSGRPLIPSLENLTLKDLSTIANFMPPYGRPTILAVTLIKDYFRQGLSAKVLAAARELLDSTSADGSWCEDIVVTALAILALHLTGFTGEADRASQWLCSMQYDNGGWPSFNQLANWSVAWAAQIIGKNDPDILKLTTPYLLGAANADGSFGTTPPYSYPDLDDTAIALLGLAVDSAVSPSLLTKIGNLLVRLQNWDGSWSTFPSFSGQLPDCTCAFPVYIKSEDITIHAIQALRKLNYAKDNLSISRGLDWLLKRQHKDGAWNSTWFLGRTYATAQAVELLLDLSPDTTPLKNAIHYLLSHQQPDGSWETRSAGETGLALYALLKSGLDPGSREIQTALRHLLSLQQPDGSFRPFYSGFYASGLYYEEPLSEALAAVRAIELYLELS